MKNKVDYKVTTFRSDGNYSDGRRPDQITFSKTLKEDVERRDLTINALAYNNTEGIIDYYGGIEDLHNKTIRCVGESKQRFIEDALRILRCYRFAFKYNFEIDSETLSEVQKGYGLDKISKERINAELCQILNYANYKQLQLFKPILLIIIPELRECSTCEQNNPYHAHNVLDHSILTVNGMQGETYMKLTMLLHDVEKP